MFLWQADCRSYVFSFLKGFQKGKTAMISIDSQPLPLSLPYFSQGYYSKNFMEVICVYV